MSGPYQKPSLNSSNPDSPLSPPPRDNTPVSFRPNVNRAKTRRWVEAKKYSYDGDDWGEDEYGEYEYDDDQPASQDQRPSVNRSTSDYASTLPKNTSRPPLPSMNSSRSMERAQTMPTESPAPSNSPPASIVRPADIYRRMREEQMAPQPAPVGPSTGEPPSATVTSPLTSSAPPEKSAIDFSYDGSYDGHGRESDYSVPAPTATNEPPALSLPDMKRLSAFSPDFSAERESNSQNQDSMSQPHELQHNPSLGFRSAVNQAFDVPETPSTIADSVARSNSDSTTAISPIIAHRSNTDLKTPTIEEEPNESIDTPTEDNLVFRPGHRRDLSLPSSGHSPSRKPIVNEPNACAPSELAHLSARTPSDSPLDVPQYPQQQSSDLTESVRQSQEMSSGRDLPPPLNVQTNVAPGPTVTAENVPVIIPSMSSDNSPEDTENDRLRKEIIRSLSRENTPSDQLDHGAPPETSKQDNLIPTEYESYWSEQQPAIRPGQEPSSSTFNPAQTASSLQAPAPISPQDAHKLQRRFSWEESSSEEDPTRGTQARPSRPPPMPGQFPFSQDNVHPDSFTTPTSQPSETVEHVGGRDESSPTPKKPKLTVVPPSAIVDAVSSPSSAQFHGSGHSQTTDTLARAEEGESFSPDRQSLEPPVQSSSASMDSGLLGFKDILGIQSSDERVKAFNRTRDQFAAIDTGLGHWVQFTIQAHPEHSDVIERNDKPLSDEFKNSVPRTKFPKLSSLGNLASSLQDGSHSTSGHIRRPSASLGSVKQNQVGKDFLHTAGVLGGHAGKAAKGLFSKGRSKLKGSGGTEKGFQSTRGYHRPVRLSDLQPDAESSLDLEDLQDLHDSPQSRPWPANRDEKPLITRTEGKEFFVRPSAPNATGQFEEQSGGQQRPAGSSNPCPIERQGEPHQDYYSRSPSKNDVEHLSAKPRDGHSQGQVRSDDEDNEDDIPDRDGFALRQLPSVSSLGVQDADPGPPPPLSQKLAPNYRSPSQVSFPTDLGDSQPRHLGGRSRPRGDRTSQGNNFAQREVIQSQPLLPARHDRPPTFTPRLSPLSLQHDWSRPPKQISLSRDPASHRFSSSPMEKLKTVSRFRRSMGSNQPDLKTGQSPKKPLNRLAGLFSRTPQRKSGPPAPVEFSSENGSTRQHFPPASPRPGSRIASSSISSFDNHDRPVSLPDGRNHYQDSLPPVDGYFAHESPESFSVTQAQRSIRATASSDRMRLSDPTPLDPRRLSPRSPPYHSPAIPQRQAHTSSPRLSSPVPPPAPRTPPSRGRSEDRTYAQELQLRSRSPKAFAPRPEERNLPKHDLTDPAFRLGAFRTSNPRTSRVGDQELPWKITIPGDSDETTADPSASWRQETVGVLNGARLPTYQEDAEEHVHPEHPQDEKWGPPLPNHPAAPADTTQPPPNNATPEHPHRSGARAINTVDAPVELPVRTDDDSGEEIMMSSTAYPGQEWRPLGFSEWEHQ